jgi:NADH:ubiquinone oxidoreductase subunit 3 (subunit A)
MLEEYLGLGAMLAAGVGVAIGLYALSSRLRNKFGLDTAAASLEFEAPREEPSDSSARSTSRYFFIAIVGLTLHASSFYFYMWGANVREAGLTGMVVMLGFGMCLIVGVFYSWARGAVGHAIESKAETRTD